MYGDEKQHMLCLRGKLVTKEAEQWHSPGVERGQESSCQPQPPPSSYSTLPISYVQSS